MHGSDYSMLKAAVLTLFATCMITAFFLLLLF